MRLLLDTQAMVWFAVNDSRLSSPAMSFIRDPNNEKLVSPARYWEIAIKISMGKYKLNAPYEDFWRNAIDANGFRYLHIEPRHTAALLALPFHHRDPFDRLQIAQAIVENIPIVSSDSVWDNYPITRLW